MEKKTLALGFSILLLLNIFLVVAQAPDSSQITVETQMENSMAMLIQEFPILYKVASYFFIIFPIIIIIDLILKGFAMWRSSKKNQKIWFWVLLLLNTMGVLPLIYLIIYRDKKKSKKKD